ncbi:deoxyribonuclease IV [Candidatus Nitrosocosmicus hydrocola]|uniref:deoxyribonuclease IV n=1 Tax=Candidatus Nitrosocosmicus hydrocola TaxID=1826872 RepID=UPI000B0972D0|nr:deoxyribonuclease IV [Candidatus Nitrosocosmicus hydrocola]
MALKLGVHVSIAGGISNSVSNATSIGCTAFQIFSRNPRQWKAKVLGDDEVQRFKEDLRQSSINPDSTIVHMPYLPNLSAPHSEMYEKSVTTLTDEITRCNSLGIPYLVIHLGSHLGKGEKNGISQLVNACQSAFQVYKDKGLSKNSVKLLLENSAGQKNSIGSKIEEIQLILELLGTSEYGICLDTCHLFAAGYDLSDDEGINKMLDLVEKCVGIQHLKLIHLNDSKGELGSNLDRHYHIGMGKIGENGFKALINDKRLENMPFIMETPIDSIRGDKENLGHVKQLRN